MKRTTKKIISIINLSISLLLITILMMTALGVVNSEMLDNTVVKTLLYVLSAAFLLTGAIQLYCAFYNDEAIKAVMLRSGITDSISISKKVVLKVVKSALIGDTTIKLRAIKLYADHRGPYMTVTINAETDDVPNTLDHVRSVTEIALRDNLSLTLNHIEVRLVKLIGKVKTTAPTITDTIIDDTPTTLEPQVDIELTIQNDSDTTDSPTYEDYVEGVIYKE